MWEPDRDSFRIRVLFSKNLKVNIRQKENTQPSKTSSLDQHVPKCVCISCLYIFSASHGPTELITRPGLEPLAHQIVFNEELQKHFHIHVSYHCAQRQKQIPLAFSSSETLFIQRKQVFTHGEYVRGQDLRLSGSEVIPVCIFDGSTQDFMF